MQKKVGIVLINLCLKLKNYGSIIYILSKKKIMQNVYNILDMW